MFFKILFLVNNSKYLPFFDSYSISINGIISSLLKIFQYN